MLLAKHLLHSFHAKVLEGAGSRAEALTSRGRRHPSLVSLHQLESHPESDFVPLERYLVVNNDGLDMAKLALDKSKESLSEFRVIIVGRFGYVDIPTIGYSELDVLQSTQSSKNSWQHPGQSPHHDYGAQIYDQFAQHGLTRRRLRHQVQAFD